MTRGDRPELHLLNPDWWTVFRDYGVNEIKFINLTYEDKVRTTFNLESYRTVANSQLGDYLETADRGGRYVGIFVSQVRMQPDQDMKSRYYKGGNRIPTKRDGYTGLAELLRKSIEEADRK